jgi:hypothetical protein
MPAPTLRQVFLVEDSRGNIVRLLKLPREVADKFHEKSPRFSFFLANLYKLWSDITGMPLTSGTIHEFLNLGVVTKSLQFLEKFPANEKELTKAIQTGDWTEFKDKFDRLTMKFSTGQLVDRAKKDGMVFPDGFFWMKLEPEECRAEGDAMGHCGSDDRGDLWSLRDKQGKPHVTMTYAPEKKTVFQIKGKQNAIPDKRYWDYILSFFKKFGAHVSDREVRLSDLGEKLREFEKVPTWEVVLDMVRNEEWDSKKIDRRVPMINVSGKLNGIPWEVTWAEQSEDYPGYFGMTIGDDTPIHFGEMEFNADDLELVHDANEVLWKTLRYG